MIVNIANLTELRKGERMGEVTENFRTFVLPNEDNNYTFNMRFEYDSWNRIQHTIYPDGEEVSYHNLGGDLYSVDGEKGQEQFPHKWRILLLI